MKFIIPCWNIGYYQKWSGGLSLNQKTKTTGFVMNESHRVDEFNEYGLVSEGVVLVVRAEVEGGQGCFYLQPTLSA